MLAIGTLVMIITAFLLLPVAGARIAWSVVIGGLAYIVPNACFARYVFRYSAADSARAALRWFYIGEAVKIIATVLVFALGFLLLEGINVAALLLTYTGMLVLNLWGNSILMNH